MTSILDRLAARQSLPSYRPTTTRDLFLLRLAQKLNEPEAAAHYEDLAGEHTDETLLLAYRRTMNRGYSTPEFGRGFHEELKSARQQPDRVQRDRLLSIKVERRSIAISVFVGTKLDFHDVRHLATQPGKAQASAVGFVRWAISTFEIESAALERMTNGNEIRRAMLNQVILTMLRSAATPVWEVHKRELLDAYAHPPLRTRSELRRAAHTILWSMFNTDKPAAHEIDAAALGLYVQTERLFL
jgi:hypothetical protein